MTDLRPCMNNILQKHGKSLRAAGSKQNVPMLDTFLQEAYAINAHIQSLKDYLISIRRVYLSTTKGEGHRAGSKKSSATNKEQPLYLTEVDRDAIDASTKSILKDLAASVTQLGSAATVRYETARRQIVDKHKTSFLARWAAGNSAITSGGISSRVNRADNITIEQSQEEDALDTICQMQESVIWYLGKKLEVTGDVQRGMMGKRLERQLEKQRSILYKAKVSAAANPTLAAYESQPQRLSTSASAVAQEAGHHSQSDFEHSLSAEQLQMFAEENQGMVKRYEETLDQVRNAEKSMLEISDLQNQLVQNLDIQTENISQLVSDSMSTSENVGSGNKELKKATERRSMARLVFWSTCGLCGFLITWDLIF